jgi:hypothetical protein
MVRVCAVRESGCAGIDDGGGLVQLDVVAAPDGSHQAALHR